MHRKWISVKALVAMTVGVAVVGVSFASVTAVAKPIDTKSAQAVVENVSVKDTDVSRATKIVGYFAEWGVYGRNYKVKNIATSGSVNKLTHIVYSFGNVKNGQCAVGDEYAAYEKAHTAEESVDGVADSWDQPLRGNFNQLLKLKKINPGLKILWSFGGWTWSSGFSEAAKNPVQFAKSCHDLVENSAWNGLFDGIDIDWEYPNACGLTCDTSGFNSYQEVIASLRGEFGSDALIASAITGDGNDNGKMTAANYAGGAQYLDWIMPMTYDYSGAFNPQGPTAPHSPLTGYSTEVTPGLNSVAALNKLIGLGVPAEKILLGIGFYGRGWSGVTQKEPGGTATGPASGTYEPGIEDYKVLKQKCPATGLVGGTGYALCDDEWWSYDTPETIIEKMNYATTENLGGAFFWELSGDTNDGELISAISTGLRQND